MQSASHTFTGLLPRSVVEIRCIAYTGVMAI